MHTSPNSEYDVVIIGGGPAGMMAAISARQHHPDYTIAIIDRTHELGRKFLTSGAGRGNLTNVNLQNGPGYHFHGDQAFIAAVFSQYGYRDIMAFFDSLGVLTYEEIKSGRGKIFPVIDHAKTVRDMFVEFLKEQHVDIYCNTPVSSLEFDGSGVIIHANSQHYFGKRVVLSVGGMTYPALGSDGSGYTIARSLGHTIIEPVVSAVPIVSKNMLSHFLQGEKSVLRATAIIDGKEISTSTGDVMFTQYGFSGPAIFDISREFSIRINRLHKTGCAVRLSFFPGKTTSEVKHSLTARFAKHPTYTVAQVLWGLLTQKAAGGVCAAGGFAKEKTAETMDSRDIALLAQTLTSFEAEVTGTRGWNEAEFTAGGVDTKEIDVQTMQSKKAPGLYIIGEMLDVDGQVGGYNLSWAWATGWIAGTLS